MPGIVRAYLIAPSITPSGDIKGKKVILAEDAVYNEEQAISRATKWREIYSSHGNIPNISYEYIPPRVAV